MKTFIARTKRMLNSVQYTIIIVRWALRVRFLGYTEQEQQQQQASSWPPVAGTTIGYSGDNLTKIYWGTDGLLQSPKPSGNFFVVTRFNQSPKQEVSYLENGSGIQTNRVRLTHGHQWDITVRDDSDMTPPKAGDTVTVMDAGGIVPCASPSRTNCFSAKVIDPSYDAAPKQAGERVLRVEALLLIEGTSGVLQIVAPV